MGQWPFHPVPPAPGHLLPPAVSSGDDEESKAGAACCAECSTVISSLNAVRQLLFSGRETAGTESKPPAHSPSFRK